MLAKRKGEERTVDYRGKAKGRRSSRRASKRSLTRGVAFRVASRRRSVRFYHRHSRHVIRDGSG